jgi:cytochrome P450
MAPAFGEKAMLDQEALISGYANKLIQGLRRASANGQAVDLVQWYNFATFDIIGDLAFGQQLGGLDGGSSNAWIQRIRSGIRLLPTIFILKEIPLLNVTFEWLFGKRLRKVQNEHKDKCRQMVDERLEAGAHGERRGDFFDHFDKDLGLTNAELAANADVFMIAGSETSATTLSGVSWLLLAHPEAFARCKAEVRSAFQSVDDITMTAASTRLPFMFACLQETFRLFPPVPGISWRETQKPMTIVGCEIPAKVSCGLSHGPPSKSKWLIPPIYIQTKIGVIQLPTYRSSRNWHRPRDFCPERWLPEASKDSQSPFYHDRREALKPFSYGPRDCIGRNLAFHEMRLILARLLWEFDVGLVETGEDWMAKQKIWTFWDKPPLMVKLVQRQ